MTNNLIQKSLLITKDMCDPNYFAEDLVNILRKTFTQSFKVYSYIVYNKKDKSMEDSIDAWRIVYFISDASTYNSINMYNKAIDIALTIVTDTLQSNVVCYKQPNIDIIVEVFKPLIKNICHNFVKKWPILEYQDAYQSCMYCLIILKNKNYYLHRNLINKVCINKLLSLVKPYKNTPLLVSFDDLYTISDNDKSINLLDVIPDTNEIIEKEDTLNAYSWLTIYEELKELLIEKIGPRRFERLFNAYGLQKGCNTAAHDLRYVKQFLQSEGITFDSFKNIFKED